MRCVYPGSFDPLTNGHFDVIERAAGLFDEVVVAVASNELKHPLFTTLERISMLTEALAGVPRVRITSFDGLLVDFVAGLDAQVIIRGLRAVSDFEFEFQMALMNRSLAPRIETVFLMPREDYSYLSSRITKEVARLGGRVDRFVPSCVERALKAKYSPAS